MLSIAMIIINISVCALGIYFFDYRLDETINNPLIIFLSFLLGLIVAVMFIWIYIEVFYVLVARRYPKQSMLKHRLAKNIMHIPLFFTNRRVTVVGKENLPTSTSFSVYSNHISLMDIPVLMRTLDKYPVAFLAKMGSMRLFSIGKWAYQIGCIGIERQNNRKGAESISQVTNNIREGIPMVIFPEGTRNKDVTSLLKFRNGAFKAALKSEKPLVPITIKQDPKTSNNKWFSRKDITVYIHKQLSYEEVGNLSTIQLSEKVREVIQSKL